jgi:hypothetical protein
MTMHLAPSSTIRPRWQPVAENEGRPVTIAELRAMERRLMVRLCTISAIAGLIGGVSAVLLG